MKRKEKNSGITLIALVVTIIVLLILAGVSIGLVFDSNGLFAKANDAATKYNQAKQDEEDYLSSIMSELDKYNGIYGGGTSGTGNPTGTTTQTPEPTPILPPKGEEPPEEGWTVEEAKGLVKRDGLKAHLGEKVQYSPAQDTTGIYRIFYYDNEVNSEDPSKGYFGDSLGTLYLKRDFAGNTTVKLSSYEKYNPSDGGEIMKKMNPLWGKESNGNSIDLINEHCVAWLCDPKEWTKYKIENVANYVIGSPSVEMYMKAYGVYKETDGDPDRNSTALVCKIGSANGYSVGVNNSYSYNTGSIEAGPNRIFLGGGVTGQYWLASPSSEHDAEVCYTDGHLDVVAQSSYENTCKVCPIVSISQ